MEIKKYIYDSYTIVNPFTAINSIEEELLEKGYVVVIDDINKFQGILTTCDLIKKPHKLVVDCLTEKEHLSADETIISALDKFKSNQCSAMPVFEGNNFIGIVERQNILENLKIKITELHNKSLISQKVKTAFLNNLSHEVRTPLNGLLGFIEIISKIDTKNINTEKEIIKKCADRFLLIMNDLIDLAVIDSGDDIKIEREKVSIENIFSDLQEYFETAISTSDKNTSIHNVNPDSSFVIFSDGKKIKQILYHLIDNAIKFSNDNSTVTFGFEIKNQNIVFFVTNKGTQITEERKKNMFDAFNKQYNHNNKLVSGLGIGLSLVKRLSELLKGKVDFVTNEIQTTFFCTIPLKG